MTGFYIQTALAGLIGYLVFAVILYSQAERGVGRGRLAAVLVSVVAFAIIVFRILHT